MIGERIGIGGMAEVYQGQDNVLGRTVAIKVMLPQYAEDPTFTARFRQEAAAAANLQSPYIVNVYDWGQDSDTSYIVMEFVRGSDLKTAIKQRGAINQRKVAEIGSQVCQALAVAHNLDIIHRDIKPQNIMVQPDGNVKVMDFGIARAKNSVKAKTSQVLGTAHYISPEQAQGKELTAASDIYSLGVVLYEASTGQLPFDGPDAVSVALKQVQETPVPPREVNPAIDPSLEAIILKAMSKDPRARFATARDMRHALNDFLSGRQVNLGGMAAADTALITNVVPVIPPSQIETEKTAVMGGTANGGSQSKSTNWMQGKDQANNGEKPRKWGRVAAVVILLALLIGGGAYAYQTLVPALTAPKTVEVPDVKGKTVDAAASELKNAGFSVGAVDYVYNDTVDADLIISQSPNAGSMQEPNTKINLSVSQGIEQVEVPDLTDMTANDARAALQKAGLAYEAGAAEHSSTIKENKVMRQNPTPGTRVAKGSTVTYILSAGEETIKVPDVVNSLEGEATAELKNAGFEVVVDYASDNNVPEGAVVSQSPRAGEKAKSGSTISLVISTGAQYYSASAYSNNPSAGSVSPEYTSVMSGGSVTFYISPNSGYVVSGVYDSNGNAYGAATSVTLSNVLGDVSLSVEFEEDPSKPEPIPSASSNATGTENASASAASSQTTGSNETVDK